MRIRPLFFLIALCIATTAHAENGYDLWLRYTPLQQGPLLQQYKAAFQQVSLLSNDATAQVIATELKHAAAGMLQRSITIHPAPLANNSLCIGTTDKLHLFEDRIAAMGKEGFLIKSVGSKIYITANSSAGLLYGTFTFLQLIQQQRSLKDLQILSAPRIERRILNHWDNLNRFVERGYAGISIWNWHTLPDYIDQRYIDYARANASIGINGTVLTNVNANATVLRHDYLLKVKALADVFRPYGIRVYLTARFSAPIELGGLKTADPLDPTVAQWWTEKIKEIYQLIPDFGGLVVKANSEGQPGPQDYQRTHADGANMLADAVAPFGGIIMWRAFVYSHETPDDRHKQAYNEFMPLDGKFRSNVIVQVKNGAIDFMPREPFHPLFGALKKTAVMPEFQITQEYLGQGTHLAYLAPLFKECLDSDTYTSGKGSTVAKIVDGSIYQQPITAIAGVANIGNDINWTSHPFAQANWYAYGRLAWDHQRSSASIAEEWLKMTFTTAPAFVKPIATMMLQSRETVVHYMNPLGLHHIMATGHHYGPGPWVNNLSRADWNPTYYHRADKVGLGFNRTSTGSNALGQYAPEVQAQWGTAATCDEKYLLWFHHVPWDFKMHSGATLWDALCHTYDQGVNEAANMVHLWEQQKTVIDAQQYAHVLQLLKIQTKDALWWKNACLLYFQQFSEKEFPKDMPAPMGTLEGYMKMTFPYAPGNG